MTTAESIPDLRVTPAGHILLAICAVLVIVAVYVLVNIAHLPMTDWIPATAATSAPMPSNSAEIPLSDRDTTAGDMVRSKNQACRLYGKEGIRHTATHSAQNVHRHEPMIAGGVPHTARGYGLPLAHHVPARAVKKGLAKYADLVAERMKAWFRLVR